MGHTEAGRPEAVSATPGEPVPRARSSTDGEPDLMPIFEKDGRRIMFAHIPKTAGTALIMAFVGAGWRMSNHDMSDYPGSTWNKLRDTFGVDHIPKQGRAFRYPHPLQHAPRIVWRTWGPFDESFAVVRHPEDRLISALKYHFTLQSAFDDLDRFAADRIGYARSRPWGPWLALGGHMIRQSAFLGPETVIFRFEEDWQPELCARYGLDPQALRRHNVSPPRPLSLPDDAMAWARRYYAPDFARLDYAPRTAADAVAPGG